MSRGSGTRERPGRVRSIAMLASVSVLQPSAQGGVCLARAAAGKKTLDTDVLVQVRPVNTFALPDESPMRAFGLVPMRQPRIPRQRDTDASAVDKIDDKGVIREGHPLRPCLGDFSLA